MPRVFSSAKDVNDRLGEKPREKGSLGHSLLLVQSPSFGEHSKGRTISIVIRAETRAG